MNLNIIIAGEGGQGVQKISEILAQAAFGQGFKTTYIPNFTVQQRGGVSLAFVRISEQPIVYPKFERADMAIVLSGRSIEQIKRFLTSDTVLIYNDTLVSQLHLEGVKSKIQSRVDATNIAKQINPRVFNIIMLGKIVKEIKVIDLESIKKELRAIFGGKYKEKPELEEQNNDALEIGYNS